MEASSTRYVEEMRQRARRVDEEWQQIAILDERCHAWEEELGALGTTRLPTERAEVVLEFLERALIEREARVADLATWLANYVESRRLVYSVLGWRRVAGDRHGPLDEGVLVRARAEIALALESTARFVMQDLSRLADLRRQRATLERRLREHGDPPSADAEEARRLVDELESLWTRLRQRISGRMHDYARYREEMRRIFAAVGEKTGSPDPLTPRAVRWLLLRRL